jgi:hypothetical protein
VLVDHSEIDFCMAGISFLTSSKETDVLVNIGVVDKIKYSVSNVWTSHVTESVLK